MALFFESINGDRRYTVDELVNYFKPFFCDGVFPNPSTGLQVFAETEDMNVTLKPGDAWLNGRMYRLFEDKIFTLDPSDSATERIDRVVVGVNYVDRIITSYVKKGTPSMEPVRPELQRDADIYEISLAEIRIGKGVIGISDSVVTDTRMDSEVCGIVVGLVDKVDTTTLMRQLEKWKEEYIEATNQWTDEQERLFKAWEELFKSDAQNWRENEERAFDEWLESIKGKLDGDTAGNLQLQIDDLVQKDIEFDEKYTQLEQNKANESNYIEYTMLAEKWAENVYSFEEDYPFAEYMVEVIGATNNTTTEQKNALDDADLRTVLTDQTVVAKDIVPKIDIKVALEVVKKNVNS